MIVLIKVVRRPEPAQAAHAEMEDTRIGRQTSPASTQGFAPTAITI